MKEMHLSPVTEAYILAEIAKARELDRLRVLEQVREIEGLLSKTPPDLDLERVWGCIKHDLPPGEQRQRLLERVYLHPELPYDVAWCLAQVFAAARPFLDQNPTVQLYKIAHPSWDIELEQLDAKSSEAHRQQEILLAMQLYQNDALSEDSLRELIGLPQDNEDESSTPVMSALTSLPDPLKK